MADPINYDNPDVQEVQLQQLKDFLEKQCGPTHVVECMMGKHEAEDGPEEESACIPVDAGTLLVHWKVRKCKHCKCLYVEES